MSLQLTDDVFVLSDPLPNTAARGGQTSGRLTGGSAAYTDHGSCR